jgi:rhodanese-related sulfurtransferase
MKWMLPRFLAEDMGFLALAVGAAIILGVTVNAARAKPLPLFPTNAFGGAPDTTLLLPEISLGELQSRIENGKGRVIDVRPSAFYALGHIHGAINLPVADLQNLPDDARLSFPKDIETIIYCSDVSCPAARAAARNLQHRGYRHFAIFPGGWYAWKRAGMPLETSP